MRDERRVQDDPEAVVHLLQLPFLCDGLNPEIVHVAYGL